MNWELKRNIFWLKLSFTIFMLILEGCTFKSHNQLYDGPALAASEAAQLVVMTPVEITEFDGEWVLTQAGSDVKDYYLDILPGKHTALLYFISRAVGVRTVHYTKPTLIEFTACKGGIYHTKMEVDVESMLMLITIERVDEKNQQCETNIDCPFCSCRSKKGRGSKCR